MSRGGRPQDGEVRSGQRHKLAPAIDPWSAGADTEAIDQWDTRPEELSEVILGFLANGQGVMFARTSDGGAVRIGLSVGPKQWKWKQATDAGEFIGIIHEMALALKLQQLPVRAVGKQSS